jgi:hypothetical protein
LSHRCAAACPSRGPRARGPYFFAEDFFREDFLAGDFFFTELRADFFAARFFVDFRVDFRAGEPFFADDFLGEFFAADLREDFFAAGLRAVFFEPDFRFGFGGTLSPSRRASDSAIAIACLRLLTFWCEPPLRSFPSFFSCITLRTFACVFLPYLAIASSFGVVHLHAGSSVTELRR